MSYLQLTFLFQPYTRDMPTWMGNINLNRPPHTDVIRSLSY